MAFGPDGALYVLDYGTGYFNGDANSALYRIEYIAGGNRAPTAEAAANRTSGQAPLTVAFSSAGSSDPEGGALTYSWAFGDGTTSTAANPTHDLRHQRQLTATLTVTRPRRPDRHGQRADRPSATPRRPSRCSSPVNGPAVQLRRHRAVHGHGDRPRGRHDRLHAGQDDLRARPRQPRPPDHVGQRLLRHDRHPGRRRARRRGEPVRGVRRRVHRQGRERPARADHPRAEQSAARAPAGRALQQPSRASARSTKAARARAARPSATSTTATGSRSSPTRSAASRGSPPGSPPAGSAGRSRCGPVRRPAPCSAR